MDAAAEAFEQQKLIRHENLLWLIVAQGVTILPLLFRLPVWLWLLWVGVMIWRLRIHSGKASYPKTWIKSLLAAGCLLGLAVSYRGSIGVDPMVGFLVCAFVLKLLELQSRKDGLLLLFIGFIAVAAQFLFAQAIYMALYASFACVVLITAWHTIYLTRPSSHRQKLKTGSLLLLHAFPLMLILFVVMPRLGPLWQVPMVQGAARTGFSDSLAPGDIGQLVKSGGTAFRVTFEGQAPPPGELYWRGLVLDTFDGRRWTLNPQWNTRITKPQTTGGLEHLTDYTLIMEPHQYQWLFALAEPISVKANKPRLQITQDGLVAAPMPIHNRLQYSVLSASPMQIKWPELSAFERKRWLQLPSLGNPKTQYLAEQWRAQRLDDTQLVAQALALFRQDFFYTLAPPTLGADVIDEFLFVTKTGFCEHFASSFTYLMRAVDVPARVVVGYQGGRFNSLENYWRVSQADAHAWAEVWLQGQGWVRVDPTNVVAPNRISQGIDSSLTEEERELVGAGEFTAPQWLSRLRNRADAAGFAWNRWVLNYNPERQGELLANLLGGMEVWRLALAFIGSCALLLGVYALLLLRRARFATSELQKALKVFDKNCAKYGLKRQPDESLSAFAARIPAQAPAFTAAAQKLASLAQQALYADAADSQTSLLQVQLLKTLRNFPK